MADGSFGLVANVVGALIFITLAEKLKSTNLIISLALAIAYRWLFAAELIALLSWMTILATDWWPTWLALYAVVTVLIVRLKWEHATLQDDPSYRGEREE